MKCTVASTARYEKSHSYSWHSLHGSMPLPPAFCIANILKRVAICLLFALCRPCTWLGTPETKQHKRPFTLYTQTMQSLLTNSLIRCSVPTQDTAYNQRERHFRNQCDSLTYTPYNGVQACIAHAFHPGALHADTMHAGVSLALDLWFG